MTQQILPKATLTSALRRCHSMELKTHRGPWYYSVLLATISVFFFFWSSHHFLLSPFLSHSSDPNKTPTFGNENTPASPELQWAQIAILSTRSINLQLWIPVVLSVKHVGTHTESKKNCRGVMLPGLQPDRSHRCSMLSGAVWSYVEAPWKHLPFSITWPWLCPIGNWFNKHSRL